MRNPKWSEDEAILLVDLYFDIKDMDIDITDAKDEIRLLSKTLRKLAALNGDAISDTFRNENGITMQLHNVQYIDTSGKEGLSSVSDVQKSVYDKFICDYKSMRSRAKSIYKKLASI